MNLCVSRNLDDIRPDRLPPATRDGPARILFLSTDALGWQVNARQLIRATESRQDLVAVHVLLRWTWWMRVLNRRVPALRHHLVHPSQTWRWVMRRWLTGPLSGSRFDVVHVNAPFPGRAVADLKGRFGYRVSVACDTTEPQFNRELSHFRGSISGGRNEAVLFAASDLMVPWSRWCAASLQNDYGIGPEKILITPPVIASPAATPPRPGGGPLRIVFVGNDFARKGGPRLVRWHQDRWAARGVELHVASAEAARHTPLPGVTFHGRLDHAKVIALIGTADLMVHPTTRDMSAVVVAEAQTLGVPVVASRLAGIPDLIDDGVSGILVDPNDDAGFVAAAESLLFDDARWQAVSAAARVFAAAHLDSRTVYGRLLDRMVALADSRGGGV